jgi:hypothetical protein
MFRRPEWGSSAEKMIPLPTFAHYKPGHAPLTVNHQGPFARPRSTAAIRETMNELHLPARDSCLSGNDERTEKNSNHSCCLLRRDPSDCLLLPWLNPTTVWRWRPVGGDW